MHADGLSHQEAKREHRKARCLMNQQHFIWTGLNDSNNAEILVVTNVSHTN